MLLFFSLLLLPRCPLPPAAAAETLAFPVVVVVFVTPSIKPIIESPASAALRRSVRTGPISGAEWDAGDVDRQGDAALPYVLFFLSLPMLKYSVSVVFRGAYGAVAAATPLRSAREDSASS